MVRVKDLPKLTGNPSSNCQQPILFCLYCSGEYSAERGDYFIYPWDTVMTHCDMPMQLVTKQIVYEKWRCITANECAVGVQQQQQQQQP